MIKSGIARLDYKGERRSSYDNGLIYLFYGNIYTSFNRTSTYNIYVRLVFKSFPMVVNKCPH